MENCFGAKPNYSHMKRVLILMLLGAITAPLKAQSTGGYIHYDPIPMYTPPPTDYRVPLSNLPQLPPPPRYTPPQNTYVKPTLNIISEFGIYSAKLNGKDFSQHYINAKAAMAFYSYSNDPSSTYMAVVMPGDNSSSTGPMSTVTNEEIPQTAALFGMTKMLFSWDFVNNPVGTKGTATVTFIKQYRPEGTAFICRIEANNGIVCEFNGMLAQ